MRIGIDIRTISNSRRGFRRLRNLVLALAHVAGEETFRLFGTAGEWSRTLLEHPRFSAEDPNRRLRMMYRKGTGLLWRWKFRDLALMHFPTGDVWHSRRCKTIVTLHDLAQLHMPGMFFSGKTEAARFQKHLRAIATYSNVIATVSDYSKREIVEKLDVAPDRVRVIRQGVEPRLAQGLARIPRQEREAALAELGIASRRYVLYCGGLDLRKNVALLLDALEELRHRPQPAPRLVIVGEWDPANPARYPDLAAAAKRRGLQELVVMPGWVEDRLLAILYAEAGVFAFPSTMEGFGYTPLEAMSCGAPVICSNAAALPETVGEAALLLPPDDPAAWADALERTMGDTQSRDELIAKGAKHWKRFDWRQTAREYLALYHEVAHGAPPPGTQGKEAQ